MAGIALALVVVVPQTALSQSLCFEDLDARSSVREADVRLGLPRRPPHGGSRRRTPSPGSLKIERTAGTVSTGGGNPVVHGGYAGCGERVRLGGDDSRARLSYARSQDWNPWRRLDGDPFAAEHFFDAEVEGPDDGPVQAGYALNMYAAEGRSPRLGGRGSTRNVTGSSFWLSGLDDRIRLRSSFGMDEPTIDNEAPLAHSHALEIEPMRFGADGSVFASFSYAEAEAGFAPGRGVDVPAGARTWSLGAGVRSDAVGMRLDYRRGRDNLGEDEWQATRAYDEWIGRIDLDAPIGGFLVPDLITFRGSVRSERDVYDDGFARDLQHHATAGWGVNMLWRDDGISAGLDLSGRMADDSALESAGVWPSQRLGLSLGTDAGDVRLFGRLYSERQRLAAALDEDLAMDYGGVLAAALFGQRLEGSVAYGRTAYYSATPALRWGLAAELDAIEVLGAESLWGWGEDVFALGRLESQFAEDAVGWQSEYTAKLVAGFRF